MNGNYLGEVTQYPQPKGTVLLRVNDGCVMRSPIGEPGRSDNTIKITALCRDLGNSRMTDDLYIFKKCLWEIQIKISFNQTPTTNLEHFREQHSYK